MSQPFRLGFLTRLESTGDPTRIYKETLDLFVVADQLGFDVAWIAQHHFKELAGRLPSPFPFLAAAAQCTRHIRLGTAVVTLPFENPLRVAEDAAVVDALSGGRLELGVGSGLDPVEFRIFGVNSTERLARTTDGLKLIQQALRGEPLDHGDIRLNPQAPDLTKRIWQSGQSVSGAQYVAKEGSGLLLSRSIIGPTSHEPTDQQQVPAVKAYLATWQSALGTPRIGMSRGIYPARDKQTALARVREDILRVAASQRDRFPAGETLENYCARLHLFYGTPEEVAEGLREDKIFPYATDLILQYSPVMPPYDEAVRILEQIATDIAPALGWQPKRLDKSAVPVKS